jgi:hypothetical protein
MVNLLGQRPSVYIDVSLTWQIYNCLPTCRKTLAPYLYLPSQQIKRGWGPHPHLTLTAPHNEYVFHNT